MTVNGTIAPLIELGAGFDMDLSLIHIFKGETFHSVGIGALLTLVGVLLIAVMLIKNVKGAILYGIIPVSYTHLA